MIDITNLVINKKIIQVPYKNKDLKIVSSSYVAADGKTYSRSKTIIDPDMTKLTKNDVELKLDISENYPFKVITTVTEDSASFISSFSLDTFPTASQSYYVPLYAERYVPEFILATAIEFNELTVESPEVIA